MNGPLKKFYLQSMLTTNSNKLTAQKFEYSKCTTTYCG